MRTYSTREAAAMIGIHRVTLQEWLAAGKVRPSQALPLAEGRTLWRWTRADIERLRQYKLAHYRKGRGPKKKARKK